MSMSDEQARAECRRLVESGFDLWLTDKIKERAIVDFRACSADEIQELQVARVKYSEAELAAWLIRHTAK